MWGEGVQAHECFVRSHIVAYDSEKCTFRIQPFGIPECAKRDFLAMILKKEKERNDLKMGSVSIFHHALPPECQVSGRSRAFYDLSMQIET